MCIVSSQMNSEMCNRIKQCSVIWYSLYLLGIISCQGQTGQERWELQSKPSGAFWVGEGWKKECSRHTKYAWIEPSNLVHHQVLIFSLALGLLSVLWQVINFWKTTLEVSPLLYNQDVLTQILLLLFPPQRIWKVVYGVWKAKLSDCQSKSLPPWCFRLT